jgi:hypothetical protein
MQRAESTPCPIPGRIPYFSAPVYFALSPFRAVALPSPNQRRLAVAVLCHVYTTDSQRMPILRAAYWAAATWSP